MVNNFVDKDVLPPQTSHSISPIFDCIRDQSTAYAQANFRQEET